MMNGISDELDRRVRLELREGEQLVWIGQPLKGRFMRGGILIMLFGVPFTAFAVFWMVLSSGMLMGAGDMGGLFACFPLFGIPFLLIGIGMLCAPIWMARLAKRTCYALTDQRAVVWIPGWFGATEVRSFRADDLGRMTRRDYADGSGDLIFEEFTSLSHNRDGRLRSYRTERGFLGIENVRDVEELIRRTLAIAE